MKEVDWIKYWEAMYDVAGKEGVNRILQYRKAVTDIDA